LFALEYFLFHIWASLHCFLVVRTIADSLLRRFIQWL
jgi:hypothetical protein